MRIPANAETLLKRVVAGAMAAALMSAPAPAAAESLDGRFDDFVDGAMACAGATGPQGVDRAALASAGWSDVVTGEIDHNPVSWARRNGNPFTLRINSHDWTEPEGCWLTAEFERDSDYDRVRRELEARIGRAPDHVEADDMRTTRWIDTANTVELWMMPEHELCGECPTVFVTVEPRTSE